MLLTSCDECGARVGQKCKDADGADKPTCTGRAVKQDGPKPRRKKKAAMAEDLFAKEKEEGA